MHAAKAASHKQERAALRPFLFDIPIEFAGLHSTRRVSFFAMKWPALILAILLAALQYPLWFGKGSWTKVREVDTELQAQRDVNAKLEARNAGLEAEVRDLKTGYEAIEERARFELGLVKPGEVFVQIPMRKP